MTLIPTNKPHTSNRAIALLISTLGPRRMVADARELAMRAHRMFILYGVLGTVVFLMACATKSERAILRVEVNAQAWREFMNPPGSYGGWRPPIVVIGESTSSDVYTNSLRQSFESAGMDPNIKTKFRWDNPNLTNAILFLSTSHPEPHRVAHVASNSFVLWLNERPYSHAMRVSAP